MLDWGRIRSNIKVQSERQQQALIGYENAVQRALNQVNGVHLAGVPVGVMSGGELQRIRIAQALASDPVLLLCDEPLLNLDNVVLSTHMAGVTREATRNAALQVTSEMLRVLRGEKPDTLVNPEVGPRLGLR